MSFTIQEYEKTNFILLTDTYASIESESPKSDN